MESYMLWQLSMCVGFLLALVVVILIVVAAMIGVLMLRKLGEDIAKNITDYEQCLEEMSDGRKE